MRDLRQCVGVFETFTAVGRNPMQARSSKFAIIGSTGLVSFIEHLLSAVVSIGLSKDMDIPAIAEVLTVFGQLQQLQR